MSIVNSILATIRFEMSRVMTLQRMGVAFVMMLFPPAMVFVLDSSGALVAPEFVIAVLCGMICLLSLLLWATSNVYTELEGRSWTFITSRPYGRWSILFGKFLISFVWSFLIAWASLTICMLIDFQAEFMLAAVESQDTGVSRLTIWFNLSVMLFLASMVYSAIFSFLGVIIQRRAMVVAVGYFLIVEIVFALIPAVIGKLAMSYHMVSLLSQWLGWIIPDDESRENFADIWGQYPPWLHLGAIFLMTGIMLGASAVIIRSREYITLEDDQV
ncbi:MAG: ABC transporter permease subunit [Pirellulaceae bacterium]